MQRLLVLMALLVIAGTPTFNLAEAAAAPNVSAATVTATGPFAVKIQHTWKASMAGARFDFADESLGTVIGPNLIVTHNHFSQPVGRLPDEAFLFEDALGRAIRWRASDVQLITLDAGTLLIRLPASVFPDIAPVAERAALQRVTPGVWLTVNYWDNAAGRLAQRDFQVIQIKPGLLQLADPDKVINPGDSGGGVFFKGQLVGNNWSINTDRLGNALGVVTVAVWPGASLDEPHAP